MHISFEGKSVIVTGASRGIGLAMAQQFARVGARVAICARGQAGLDAASVTSYLNSGEGTDEVNKIVQFNYKRGISGVPFYIINNQYGLSGAQPADVFVQALKQIGETIETSQAEACDVNNPNC